MSTATQEGVFILLKVIKRDEEKWPEGRTELMKLKTTFYNIVRSKLNLKVELCKLYNNKYIIASAHIANTEIFAVTAGLASY